MNSAYLTGIMDGWQVEYPDNWLSMGEHGFVPRPDESEEVYFDGYVEENWSDSGLKTVHKDYTRVLAVPYDILISGNGDIVNKLRIWGAKVLIISICRCFHAANISRAWKTKLRVRRYQRSFIRLTTMIPASACVCVSSISL